MKIGRPYTYIKNIHFAKTLSFPGTISLKLIMDVCFHYETANSSSLLNLSLR